MKSGNLNFLEPCEPLQACNGTALTLYLAPYQVFLLSVYVVTFFVFCGLLFWLFLLFSMFSCILPPLLATSFVYLCKLHVTFQSTQYFAVLYTGLYKLLIGKD